MKNQHVAATRERQQKGPHSLERNSLFVGPLPPPELLEKYNQIQPGFADRILSMTEKEGTHRHSIDELVVRKSFGLANLGIWAGLSSVCVVTALCFYCVYMGYPTQAATIATVVLAALATVFVLGRKATAKTPDKKIE